MTTESFYKTVLAGIGGGDREAARRLTAAVFHTLRDRLTQSESDQVFAQLPRDLKQLWAEAHA